MSLEEKIKNKEQTNKWRKENKERWKEISQKSYLKRVGGSLSRISKLASENEKKEHRKKRKRETSIAWQKANPEKVAAIRLKQKINGNDNAKAARRRAAKLKATPPWADLEEIKNVYLEAQYFGMHVDHIIPLQGKEVCGLHIWENLQLLTPEKNIKKGNKLCLI